MTGTVKIRRFQLFAQTEEGRQLIHHLSFRDTPVKDVITEIARRGNVNIIIDKSCSGKITGNVRNINLNKGGGCVHTTGFPRYAPTIALDWRLGLSTDRWRERSSSAIHTHMMSPPCFQLRFSIKAICQILRPPLSGSWQMNLPMKRQVRRKTMVKVEI